MFEKWNNLFGRSINCLKKWEMKAEHTQLFYLSTLLSLGLYLKVTFTKRQLRLFIALLIVAKNWKQPKCPSTVERINKLWYIHNSKYCRTIKKWTTNKKVDFIPKKFKVPCKSRHQKYTVWYHLNEVQKQTLV